MPATKTVMNVDSLVAKLSARAARRSAPGGGARGAVEEAEDRRRAAQRDRRRCRCPRARSARSTGTTARTPAAPPAANAATAAELARAARSGSATIERAHQRRREPGGEVRVAEQRVDRGRQVEAQRPVQQRVVLRSRRVLQNSQEKYASWLSSWWNGRSPRSIRAAAPARRRPARPRRSARARLPARRRARRGAGRRRGGGRGRGDPVTRRLGARRAQLARPP